MRPFARGRLEAFLLASIFITLSSVHAQRRGSDPLPPPQTHYLGREIAQTMHFLGAPWLMRDSRQREEDGETMLRELKVTAGMTVCDMGCGSGFYTLQLAAAVGAEGRVLAVDIQPEMLRLMEARAAEKQLTNIRSILGSVVEPQLPAAAVDLILCVDVYHEFAYPQQMLAAMRQALKPQGRLVLVEFRAEDPQVPIKPLHKMSKQQLLKELTPNGFRLVAEFDQLPWQHMMFFGRDDSHGALHPAQRRGAPPLGRPPHLYLYGFATTTTALCFDL